MFNPPIVDLPAALADLSALLAIIQDPATHQARLDELKAQQKATDERIAALNDMAADTRRLHSAAEALTIVLTNRKTALDTREAEIEEKAKILEQSDRMRSDEALRKREAAVQSREQAAAREAERLAAIAADYEKKRLAHKNLAGALEG